MTKFPLRSFIYHQIQANVKYVNSPWSGRVVNGSWPLFLSVSGIVCFASVPGWSVTASVVVVVTSLTAWAVPVSPVTTGHWQQGFMLTPANYRLELAIFTALNYCYYCWSNSSNIQRSHSHSHCNPSFLISQFTNAMIRDIVERNKPTRIM